MLVRVWCSFISALILCCACVSQNPKDAGWPVYGGDGGGQRYSPASQITPENVNGLRPVWEYRTGALTDRKGRYSASFEATPILHGGKLYFATPFNEIVSLDAQTGSKLWSFDPKVTDTFEGGLMTSRGVAYWSSDAPGTGPCHDRIIEATIDGRLLAVDAVTGKPCGDFGPGGEVNLKTAEVAHRKGDIFPVTSAPAIVGNVVIVGSSLSDNSRVDIDRGTVRGYDVRSGRELWGWNPLPWAESQKVRTGAGNAWGPLAVDPQLGLVFLPTGSASPDYFGGMRPGNDADADSVVALDAKTGHKVWSFQLVHHDLWDYDVAAEPLLFTFHGSIPAVAVSNKSGMVYVLDRRTGKPLYPVEERAVPQSDVPGEQSSPTQPFSTLPRLGPSSPFAVDGAQWTGSSERKAECDKQFAGLRYEGEFTPPSLRGTLIFPGKLGGVNWGSMAFDPETGFIYANNNRFAYQVKLVPHASPNEINTSHATRAQGLRQRVGGPRYVYALAAILLIAAWMLYRKPRVAVALAVLAVVVFAYGRHLHAKQVRDEKANADRALRASSEASYHLLHTIRGLDDSPQSGTPYGIALKPVADSAGLPCNAQPWSAMTSIDLEHGTKRWDHTLGTMVTGAETGSVELGGPVVTAGGLVFTAGTIDPYLRAFDKKTGSELWKGELPVPAQATPMTYSLNGRQYVVIAAGGHGLFNTTQGDSLIAFALPLEP